MPTRDRPLVTAAFEKQRRVIASVDDAAKRAGLAVGMTVTHAQSLIPDLTVVDAAPEDDTAALRKVATWCMRYSPLVAPNPPDGVFIDVAGAAHLFQGEEALIRDLLSRMKAQHIAAKAALADTPGCAWAMARYGATPIVAPGRASEAMASLPVSSLRLSAQIVEALHEVGIERVAHIASKPRASLQLRFGGDVLLRFDQAMGSISEPLNVLLPEEEPSTVLRFVDPLADPEDLKRVIKKLCTKLCPELEQRGMGARRLDLVFLRVDNIAQAVRVALSRPYREPKHLTTLLEERLVLVDPGFGIEQATLTASWVEALSERQTVGGHLAPDGNDVDVGQLVDTLGVRLGPKAVFRLAPVESHLPERSVKRIPPLHPPQGTDWPKTLPRPARLFSPPEAVLAIAALPDHPPRLFVWHNRQHRITRADGPERIHGEWWRSDTETELVRDYYRVETADGARYWLFRDGPAGTGGTWWLHGIGEA